MILVLENVIQFDFDDTSSLVSIFKIEYKSSNLVMLCSITTNCHNLISIHRTKKLHASQHLQTLCENWFKILESLIDCVFAYPLCISRIYSSTSCMCALLCYISKRCQNILKFFTICVFCFPPTFVCI